MSRRGGSTRLHWQIVITSYPCPICGAGPGWGCKTEGRRPKTEPHADRTRLAHNRGWAAADMPARCVACTGPLPEGTPDDGTPVKCRRCRPRMATRDEPGPDGSYDVPLFGEDA